jgi:hypothetical protein
MICKILINTVIIEEKWNCDGYNSTEVLANHELSTVFRYEEKEKRRKRHKSASTKSHKDSDSSDTETSPSSRSHTPGQYNFIPVPDLVKKKGRIRNFEPRKYNLIKIIIENLLDCRYAEGIELKC